MNIQIHGDMLVPFFDDFQIVDLAVYMRTWELEHGTSIPEFPGDPEFRRYACPVQVFIAAETYPVWFTDPERQRFIFCKRPLATPIRFLDLAGIPHLREIELAKRASLGRGRQCLHAIVEHCAGCGVRIAKDGCKDLLHAAVTGRTGILHVMEVSGHNWTTAKFDMAVTCLCRTGKKLPDR